MPLTVEPSKPRLCNDDRFLNLWIEDRPFALDSVQHLPKYLDKGFYQTVCDGDGFVIDSERQAFTLLPHKKEKFLCLVKETLPRDTLDLLTLQRLSGKCVSMSLAVSGARLYVNEINLAVSRATRSSRPVKMSAALKNEIEHWLFLETWEGTTKTRLFTT